MPPRNTTAALADGDRAILQRCLNQLLDTFRDRVYRPVSMSLNYVPDPIRSFSTSLSQLESIFSSTNEYDFTGDLPILKTALLHQLHLELVQTEEWARRTPDKETKAALKARIEPIVAMAASDWVAATEAAEVPILSDYLVVSQIEAWFKDSYVEAPRVYDEKFGTLYAPTLFLSDLAHQRIQCCEFRDRPVTVGYLDIDDFKAFNTRLGEPRVDSEVLPVFMRILEAAAYRHGHAYRFGGDEYAVLLPNQDQAEAVRFFHRLQADLATADYGGVGPNPTVSIGLCEVRRASSVTDRQVEQLAATAKAFAKQAGKDCVAGYGAFARTTATLQVFPRHPRAAL